MAALNAWFNKFESEQPKLANPDDQTQGAPTMMDYARFDRETEQR